LKRQPGAHKASKLTLRLKVQAAPASDVASSTQQPQTRREQEAKAAAEAKAKAETDAKAAKAKAETDAKAAAEKAAAEKAAAEKAAADAQDTSVVQKKWETISAERAEECRRKAMQRGGKPLNTSRLNIVGEGRAGKTAWLRSVSNEAFEHTDSTIGVKQSLLEVKKVDMETKCEGAWSVVPEGALMMTADEAMTRLAAEIAVKAHQVVILANIRQSVCVCVYNKSTVSFWEMETI
jgi:hypothetical protein